MYATKVTDRVYQLDTYALGSPRTVSAYLIKGPRTTLVDCGYASSYRNVLSGLSETGVSPAEVEFIVATHVHLDHAGAAGDLIESMPNAQVLAHERGVPHLVDPTKLVESATKVFGPKVMGMYGLPKPVPPERIVTVGESYSLDLGEGLAASLIHTPGHAPHQMSVFLEGPKILLTADAVGIVYPGLGALIPTTPPPSFRPDELVRSVERLRQTDPALLLIPHFGKRGDPAWVFDCTVERVRAWVKEVGELRDTGASLDEASGEMERQLESETGGPLPIYAKVSVRTSVMGILHYFDKA